MHIASNNVLYSSKKPESEAFSSGWHYLQFKFVIKCLVQCNNFDIIRILVTYVSISYWIKIVGTF